MDVNRSFSIAYTARITDFETRTKKLTDHNDDKFGQNDER